MPRTGDQWTIKSYITPLYTRLTAALIGALFLPAGAFAQAPAASAQSPTVEIAVKLPRDLSPWGMFLAADVVVKAVMLGLVFASVLTWTILFAKMIELITARRRMHATIGMLSEARSLADGVAHLSESDEVAG